MVGASGPVVLALLDEVRGGEREFPSPAAQVDSRLWLRAERVRSRGGGDCGPA